MKHFLTGLAFLLLVSTAGSQAQTLVFRGARILPISAPPIDNGVIVVEDGLITAIGISGEVELPAGATIHDLSDKTLIPGMVDTHSHIGGPRGGAAKLAAGGHN